MTRGYRPAEEPTEETLAAATTGEAFETTTTEETLDSMETALQQGLAATDSNIAKYHIRRTLQKIEVLRATDSLRGTQSE